MPDSMPNRFFSRPGLERALTLATALLGAVHAWAGRYSMNPDGISYLDVGSSFIRHDWANALNAWWSPLYAWTLGVVIGAVRPSPRWEFPLAQAVNFVIFLGALFAFRYFLASVLNFCHRKDRSASTRASLPDWALILIAYATFWWACFELIALYDLSADLAVLGCVCLGAALLLQLEGRPDIRRFAVLGLVLGVGYWTKTVLFPLGFVFLACAYLWKRSSQDWRRGILVAGMVFVCVTAPLVYLLSRQKGRFTFGDSGRVNYAWNVSPRTPIRNWQGEVPESGTPVHATRQLLQHPPLFEFDGPVIGTYPPWTDPSYWNEGLRPHFKLKPQMEVLATTLPSEIRVLLRAQPGLLIGIIVVVLMCPARWLAGVRELWPFIVVPVIGMAFYLPLVVNDRYLAGFVLVLFVTLYASAQVRSVDLRPVAYVATAIFVAMALGTLDVTVRYATNHLAVPGVGPNSTIEDVIAAEQLPRYGASAGDKVAIIGDGTSAYWARLAKVRIVAEVMGGKRGAQEFWNAPQATKHQAYSAFASAHATVVMSSCPAIIPADWTQIAGTNYCVLQLARNADSYARGHSNLDFLRSDVKKVVLVGAAL